MVQVAESKLRRTTQVTVYNRPAAPSVPIRTPLVFSDGSETPWRLLLEIGESGSSVPLDVVNQVIIGRSDLVDGHVPGLDLEPYGGQDYGVSRTHAVLYVEEGSLYIRDLASTNGTRVNDFALEPDQ